MLPGPIGSAEGSTLEMRMSLFSPTVPELRNQVDDFLDRFLNDKFAAIPEARPLIDEISRLLHLGGKRLRPAFCYWGYRAGGGAHSAEIVAASGALELLHTFALVHDDIMDSASLRRGEKTTRAAHGENFALLTGDLALVLADAALMESGFSADVLQSAFGVYSRMRQEVIAGQYLDLALASEQEVTEGAARRVAMLKSGLYSIVEPLTIGAVLAGAQSGLIEELRELAGPLGEAFQLRDDLLGIFGDADVVGKSVDSDIREGKRHLLYVRATRLAQGPQRSFLLARWGAEDLQDHEVNDLRGIVESSGARKEVEDLLAQLAADARRTLSQLSIDAETGAALEQLVEIVIDRDS